MTTTRARRYAVFIALAGIGFAAPAFAQDKTVKIGVLNDMSSLYADIGGPKIVGATHKGGEGFRPPPPGRKSDGPSGGHTNKTPNGAHNTPRWSRNEEGRDATDTPHS